MPKLHILISSTRPGRKGPLVAEWVNRYATEHGGFDVELVDLKEMGLPLFDEPHHPMTKQYENEHTKRWSAKVAEADAFVFVTPEYDYSTPPSLLNALVYLFHEWQYKPVAFVSYGGISGGLRALQSTKLTVTALKMVPIVEAVNIPFFTSHIEGNVFNATENHERSAKSMLDELARWAGALRPLRSDV